ncbi:MAG: hypothetical protein M3Z04_05795 [Chloroflexota bacterium]|nr:hypothetical protein [Chloroflexota bacterium]
MARIILADGGQRFTLPDETVTTDQQVVEILRQSYPELGTPTIQRETQAGELVITVIKRPGSKG